MATLEHDGVTLMYDELGDADAPPVALLHGVTSSRRTWSELAPRLADRFRVLALDFRGHGESDRAPGAYTVPGYGSDAVALIEQVAEGPAIFIGHSLGRITSAYVAATRPDLVRAAFLEDPPMFIIDPEVWEGTLYGRLFPVLQQAIADAQASDHPEGALRKLTETMPSLRGGTLAEALGPEGVELQVYSWSHFDPQALAGDELLGVWGDHNVDSAISCPLTVARADPTLEPAFFPHHEERVRRLAPTPGSSLRQAARTVSTTSSLTGSPIK